MCGIAGIYAYREAAAPVDEGELLRIREAMIHRGPDGAGLWVSPDSVFHATDSDAYANDQKMRCRKVHPD